MKKMSLIFTITLLVITSSCSRKSEVEIFTTTHQKIINPLMNYSKDWTQSDRKWILTDSTLTDSIYGYSSRSDASNNKIILLSAENVGLNKLVRTYQHKIDNTKIIIAKENNCYKITYVNKFRASQISGKKYPAGDILWIYENQECGSINKIED